MILLAIHMDDYHGETYPLFTIGDCQITTDSMRPPGFRDEYTPDAIVAAVNGRPALLAENARLRAAAKGVLTHPRRPIIYSLWDEALDAYVCIHCASLPDEPHGSNCAVHVLFEALAAAAGEGEVRE